MDIGMDAVRAHERVARRVRARRAAARGARDRAVRAAGPGPAGRRRAVQPAGHPSARCGPGARSLRDRRPGRPPLHDAAPRAARPGGHGARELQRLHDDRRHRPAGDRSATRSSASSTASGATGRPRNRQFPDPARTSLARRSQIRQPACTYGRTSTCPWAKQEPLGLSVSLVAALRDSTGVSASACFTARCPR